MRAIYLKTIKRLQTALTELDAIDTANDLAALHRFVVDLKTSLPERVSYENSPLLLGGLRVTTVEAMPEYVERLRARLQGLLEDYQGKAGSKSR
ncbi:hypothetical protein KQI52_11780 [bacterium]|nr:hypothetical protein [bacterium]